MTEVRNSLDMLAHPRKPIFLSAAAITAASAASGRAYRNTSLWGTSQIFEHIVVPKAFLSLPLGTVKPSGWLYDQVRLLNAPLRLGRIPHALI